MSFEQIEPRVKYLEKIQQENQVTLRAIETDFHHMTKAVDKIQEALSKFAEVFSKVENFEGSVRRAHDRIDQIQVKLDATAGEFNVCKKTKLNHGDIGELTKKITAIEINIAKNAWIARLAWLVVTPVVTSIVLGVMGFLFIGGVK